jgi:hypothetical protein
MTQLGTVGLITLIGTVGAAVLGLPLDVWRVLTIVLIALAVALFCQGWRPR